MKYAQALACIAGLLQATAALPSTAAAERRQTTCTSPRLRKSWDSATASERKAYIDAAVCLTKKPSKLGLAGATMHDDFAWVHNKLSAEIHGVAAFLPWHRFFIHVYEKALKTECGYTGTALYWDWVQDSAAPASASVWDPVTGFGGDGVSPDGSPFSYCVADGPFADFRPVFWGNETQPHCLQRQFMQAIPEAGLQEMLGFAYNENVVAGLFTHTDFVSFKSPLEGSPHGAVHAGISGSNGDMGPMTSPNDPIFFLHHTMVDRIWWQWQQESSSRTFDYGGNIYPEPQSGTGATLDDVMKMGNLAADRTVREFMDAGNAELCYTYYSKLCEVVSASYGMGAEDTQEGQYYSTYNDVFCVKQRTASQMSSPSALSVDAIFPFIIMPSGRAFIHGPNNIAFVPMALNFFKHTMLPIAVRKIAEFIRAQRVHDKALDARDESAIKTVETLAQKLLLYCRCFISIRIKVGYSQSSRASKVLSTTQFEYIKEEWVSGRFHPGSPPWTTLQFQRGSNLNSKGWSMGKRKTILYITHEIESWTGVELVRRHGCPYLGHPTTLPENWSWKMCFEIMVDRICRMRDMCNRHWMTVETTETIYLECIFQVCVGKIIPLLPSDPNYDEKTQLQAEYGSI
ncbi:Tyrosinase ustQ [Paramyrothecium foliicola]|nr:Tyrosinase ustQ [Paramyrothecium foliicola]